MAGQQHLRLQVGPTLSSTAAGLKGVWLLCWQLCVLMCVQMSLLVCGLRRARSCVLFVTAVLYNGGRLSFCFPLPFMCSNLFSTTFHVFKQNCYQEVTVPAAVPS